MQAIGSCSSCLIQVLEQRCQIVIAGGINARGCHYEVWCWQKHFKRLSRIFQEASLTVADAAAGKEAFGNCLVLGLSDLTVSWQSNFRVSILAGGMAAPSANTEFQFMLQVFLNIERFEFGSQYQSNLCSPDMPAFGIVEDTVRSNGLGMSW